MFPIHDPGHTKAASGRISQAWHEGRLTPEQHHRAVGAVVRAEHRFGITPGPGSYGLNAFEELGNTEHTGDGLKLAAIGGVLAGTALLAWYCRPKDEFAAKKAAGAPAHGHHQGGLAALAATLTPAQKAAVHAARAAGMTPVQALASVGISPAALASAAAR